MRTPTTVAASEAPRVHHRAYLARAQAQSILPRIPAHLIIHGGTKGLATVVEGLVRHNENLIRAGLVAPLDLTAPTQSVQALTRAIQYSDGVRRHPDDKPVWRDALVATVDHVAHAGTLAAWQAASLRVRGTPANLTVIQGIPRVVIPDGAGPGAGCLAPDASLTFGRSPVNPVYLSGLHTGDDHERWDDWIVLSLLDPEASGIGEVNTAIARHNARLIAERNLPPLYASHITYVNEGVPERWLDAQQIVIEGGDDCEGLAAYRAGELIAQGYDARVFCRDVSNSGVDNPAQEANPRKGRTFHALCGVFDGDKLLAVDDPSPRAPAGAMPVPTSYLAYAAKRRARGQPL